MGPTMHQLDPEGDTLLTLAYSSLSLAQNLYRGLKPNALPQYDTYDRRNKEERLWTAPNESGKTSSTGPIQMRLSSKHLKLASDYFRKMMASNWKESEPKDGYSFSVKADGWNEEALLIVMSILHGRTSMIPHTMDFEMLAKVAVIVDYYQCHEATHFFTRLWMRDLKDPLPTSFGRSLLLRFLVSWVFSEADTFRHSSQIIIRESRGPVDTKALPIPTAIIDALEEKRQEMVSGVLSGLNNLKVQLSGTNTECSFECSSMTLGALLKGMQTMGLLDPLPTSPFEGYSFMTLEETIKQIKEPNYSSISHMISGGHYSSNPRKCSLKAKLNAIIDEQSGKAEGLDLDTFYVKAE